MPLGLTNALVTLQSCRKWQRHLLLLLFDALIIYNRTWEVHLSQLDEIGGIMAMTGVFHLDHMISAQSAQEEIQTLLEWFTEIATGIGSGGLPIWWWDPGIHWSDRLLQMMRMIDRVVSVIGLRLCEDIVRGVVELCPIGEVYFPSRYPGSSLSTGWKTLTSLRCFGET
jgi:hypothetical protein